MTDLLETHVHLLKPSPKGDARTLLLLHGTGDDERSFSRVGAVVAPEAAVLSVRGNVRENGMNRFFRRRAEGVYDMADLARRTTELIAFVDAAVRHYGLAGHELVPEEIDSTSAFVAEATPATPQDMRAMP
jgi:phospholipase/carboxylesterase